MNIMKSVSNFAPTKKMLAWAAGGAAVLTMAVGFTAGGWVTAATADRMAQEAAAGAYTELAAAVCATNFVADADTGAMRDELLALTSYKQRAFVQEQQWALMPGEIKVTRPVAELCVRKIAEMDPIEVMNEKPGIS